MQLFGAVSLVLALLLGIGKWVLKKMFPKKKVDGWKVRIGVSVGIITVSHVLGFIAIPFMHLESGEWIVVLLFLGTLVMSLVGLAMYYVTVAICKLMKMAINEEDFSKMFKNSLKR